ncbi:uncharacterized protein BDW70DRAFT_164982 [Aspergillus foveolatus]|uniref:uncharacterized protein n=1 Tax=Aspergillus foveolatus TaxID=210207 RepID=UPI003CCDC7A1
MDILVVGVQKPDRKTILSLDYTAYFDFMHGFGKRLRLLGQLAIFQRDNLMRWLEAGGAIRWSIFWTGEASGLSIPWSSCVDEYWISFELVGPGPGESRVVLDQDAFRQLAEELSIDFETLRYLERFRVADIYRRLTALEYVRSFVVEKELFDPHIPGYSKNDGISFLLPTDHVLPTSDLGAAFPVKYPMHTANNAGQEFDNLFLELDSGSSPGGYVKSPPEDESLTFHDPRILPSYIASPGPASGYLSQQHTAPIANDFSTIVFPFLRSPIFGEKGQPLDDKRIQDVLEVHHRFCTYDLVGSLYSTLIPWLAGLGNDLPGLGLPLVWRGVQGAVNYLRALDADNFTHPLAARFALILFSLNYYELCRHPGKFSTHPSGRTHASSVLDCILDEYTDDPRISDNPRSRRNKITTVFAREGHWWWEVGATLGVGSWRSKSFTNGQINALATLSQNTRPGTVRLFHSLQFVAKAIMLGRITDELSQAWSNAVLSGPDKLALAREEDQEALARLQAGSSWPIEDAKRSAKQKMEEFLAFLNET